jgi:four helix bundle protein
MGIKDILQKKSFDFALDVVKCYKMLAYEKKEFVLSKQLLRSGTAVGALIREAEHAQSRADFIHKLSISLKESNETDYWIDLLVASDYINKETHKILKEGNLELLKLLTSIIKNTKLNT